MEGLLNIVRREVARGLGMRGFTRVGLVDSYDPVNHAAKVLYQPEGVLSGWLAVGSGMSGNGYGVHFAPSRGDQVLVHFLEGSKADGVIGMRLFSTADRPLNVPAGELWAIHASGSGWKFHNDGSGEIVTAGALTATVGGDLNADITGAATITAASVNLGGTGGRGVARIGDPVAGGVITGGSGRVTAV